MFSGVKVGASVLGVNPKLTFSGDDEEGPKEEVMIFPALGLYLSLI